MSTVYSNNRDLIDDDADRRFFVRDGVECAIHGGPAVANPPLHPDHEERGTRDIPVGDSVLVEDEDLPEEGERVWLKGFGPVRHTEDGFEYTDDDLEVVRSGEVDVIHWVPASGNVSLCLRTIEGDVTGHAEPGYSDYDENQMVQFERVGFARVDQQVPDGQSVAYYAHP
jgi:glutamyl-tRNA synthetase